MNSNEFYAKGALIALQGSDNPGRLKMMIGARAVVAIEYGVRFYFDSPKLGCGIRCDITVNASDYFDIIITQGANILHHDTDVFCEDLQNLFEGYTGLFTSFTAIKFS